MNEAMSTPKVSTVAKADQLKRAAGARPEDMRKAAARQQLLREKLERLEQLERHFGGQLPAGDGNTSRAEGNGTSSNGGGVDLLAGLSDASWDEIKEQLDGLHKEVERYVRDNPTKAVLTAAGAGFVLGLLMKR